MLCNDVHYPSFAIKMRGEIRKKFNSYPAEIASSLLELRALIYFVAEQNNIPVEEELKWNEPSYNTKKGSPIRIGWNSKNFDEYAMYFHCQTRLVETFREIFPDVLSYVNNRAIVLSVNQSVPEKELKRCVLLALTYHEVKHLPLLGEMSPNDDVF